jgi:hypothetical protein
MTFVNKILEGKIDDEIHKALVRFSKGTFENRALISVNVTKNKFNLKCSFDLVKDLLISLSSCQNKFKVNGRLFKSRKKTEVDEEISNIELKKLCDENEFIFLDILADDIKITCKKVLPKPGKDLKDNFCTAKNLPLSILKNLIFETDKLKKAKIHHTFQIDEIIVPAEYKDDFALARLHSKRKGTLTRYADIDGSLKETKKAFVA